MRLTCESAGAWQGCWRCCSTCHNPGTRAAPPLYRTDGSLIRSADNHPRCFRLQRPAGLEPGPSRSRSSEPRPASPRRLIRDLDRAETCTRRSRMTGAPAAAKQPMTSPTSSRRSRTDAGVGRWRASGRARCEPEAAMTSLAARVNCSG